MGEKWILCYFYIYEATKRYNLNANNWNFSDTERLRWVHRKAIYIMFFCNTQGI